MQQLAEEARLVQRTKKGSLAYKSATVGNENTFNNMPQLVSLGSLYDIKNCKSGRCYALNRWHSGTNVSRCWHTAMALLSVLGVPHDHDCKCWRSARAALRSLVSNPSVTRAS